MRPRPGVALGAALGATLLLALGVATAEDPPVGDGTALLADVAGPLGPATVQQVQDLLDEAEASGAALVILRLDTPGGLLTSTRELVQAIVGAPVPVVVYVAPTGARAASAGTFLLYASHVAAMAPGTNVGAATPVPIGGGADASEGQAKALHDAAALLRGLARLRGRDAEWAERAVREGESLTAAEAAAQGVIEVVAADLPALVRALDGRRVRVGERDLVLATTGLALERRAPGWRVQALQALSDPNVALILLLLGVYGLVFELASPGGLGPGIVGGICLLLGLYALSILPVDLTGVALLLLGLGCMVAEAFVPSFGVLGVGGLCAFALGAFLLTDTAAPGFRVAWEVVLVTAALSAALLVFGLRYVWRAQRRPVTTGVEGLAEDRGQVLDWAGGRGHVLVAGERWSASGPLRLAPGEEVAVVAVAGLRLEVAPPTARARGARAQEESP